MVMVLVLNRIDYLNYQPSRNLLVWLRSSHGLVPKRLPEILEKRPGNEKQLAMFLEELLF